MSSTTLRDILQQYLTTREKTKYEYVLIRKRTLGFGTTNPCTLGSILRQLPRDILVSATIYSTFFSTRIFEKRVNNSELSDELIVATYKFLIHSYYSNQSSLPFYGVFPVYPCLIGIEIYSDEQSHPLTLVFLDERAYLEFTDMCSSRKTSEIEKKMFKFKEPISHDLENPLKQLLRKCINHSLLFEDTRSASAPGLADVSQSITHVTDTSGRTINDILKRSLLRSLSNSDKRSSRGRSQWLHHDGSSSDGGGGEGDNGTSSSVLFDENSRQMGDDRESILVLQSLADPDPFLENMGCHIQMGAEALGILLNDVSSRFQDDIRDDDMSLLTEPTSLAEPKVLDGDSLRTTRFNGLDVGNTCTEANFPHVLPIIVPGALPHCRVRVHLLS